MKKIFSIITIVLVFVSCNKFGDTNVNPTLLTAASTRALLTNSLQSYSSLIQGNAASARLGSLYVQHLSEGPYPGPSLYSDRNLSFAAWYTGPLYNLETIIKYNNDGNAATVGNGSKDNQIAVARILKAHYYLMMTDRWGDIPYKSALKGSDAFSPAYDKQQDIYTDLFKELTEAVAQIKENEAGVVGDVLLNGDMAAWKRFANTQRMIMALRLSKADAAKGKTEYAAALAACVNSSNAQNISYAYVAGDTNNYNPWYNNYTVSNRNDYAISKTMTDYMEPKADPRLPVFGEVVFYLGHDHTCISFKPGYKPAVFLLLLPGFCKQFKLLEHFGGFIHAKNGHRSFGLMSEQTQFVILLLTEQALHVIYEFRHLAAEYPGNLIHGLHITSRDAQQVFGPEYSIFHFFAVLRLQI